MKKYTAPNGKRILLDGETVCNEVCTPDNFDETRIRYITEEEAEAMQAEATEEAQNG